MHRYLVFLWSPTDHAARAKVDLATSAILETQGWSLAFSANGASVLHHAKPHQSAKAYLLSSRSGAIIGSLYRRTAHASGSLAYDALHGSDTELILASRGQYLVDHFWGSYVALLHDRERSCFSVLRDPTANLACYRVQWSDIHVFFSDIEDLTQSIPVSLSADWQYMCGRLINGLQLSRRCGLREVEDIPGGESFTLLPARVTREVLWHPAQFCVEDGLQDLQSAARELRTTVLDVVKNLASDHERVLVLLSGGLDSSIVASCLSQCEAGPLASCLNFYILSDADDSSVPALPGYNRDDMAKVRRIIGGTDERRFAEIVAQRCRLPLIEREMRVPDLDFSRLQYALLSPRPSNYIFALFADEVECECAIAHGATACFTGLAGDAVFYCTQRVVGALDYAYMHPFGPASPQHVHAAATLSGESYLRVLGKIFKYSYLGRPLPHPFDASAQAHLLLDEAASAGQGHPSDHPWVQAAPRLCPGKRDHVAAVATSVPFYAHAHRRERIAPALNPLASQPVVETCLRIPTYVLLADGVSRGLARHAFRQILPPEVVRRTVKGGGIAFWQRLLRYNMAFVRERLLDGILVKERLLDCHKLEQFLVPDQPFLTVQPHQIMDYLACESWLDQWIARSRRPSAIRAA